MLAGVLEDGRGRVLLARRPDSAHQGGLWEFPGGKRERGEGRIAALARELREELGVEVERARPLIRVPHDYADRGVLLDVWRVERWRGAPRGEEGQRLAWVAPAELDGYPLPAADRPIVNAVRLPAAYLVTPQPGADRSGFLEGIDASLAAGVRMVRLRAPQLGAAAYRALARDAGERCRRHGASLLVDAGAALAGECGAHGVHLERARLHALSRRPLPPGRWVAASCSGSADLEQALRLGVDFVVVSPLRDRPRGPLGSALGWRGFRRLVEPLALPAYAAGGTRPRDLAAAWRNGAQGIAGTLGLWAGERGRGGS